jgi:SAM-dependent methyltransferase
MAWYEDWFGSEAYTLVYQHRDEDEAADLIDLLEEAVDPADEARILDMGCGRGRHARLLARRGYDVVGVDLSPRAVAEARAQADDEGLDVTFQTGDMRDPVCSACFDGVTNLFTAFGYFEADADNKQALAAMTQALRPGGWFVQDFLNAPHVIDTLVPEDTQTVNGLTVRQERWVDDGRIEKEITITSEEGDRKTFHESVRLFTLYDLKRLYDAVGLELKETFGDYDGATYTPSSPRLILHAEKRGTDT